MAEVIIRPVGPLDQPWLEAFIAEDWGAAVQVVRGETVYPHRLPGFVAEDGGTVVGVATYRFLSEDCCELITLNALTAGSGIGTALVKAVIDAARSQGCRRLVVVTTNDNLNALRFYQKRGFVFSQLRPNVLARSRQIKPQIPLIGLHGIPLRDEIELEMDLDVRR
jgi:N-acetylglutamate synthase-like GNAT family acetyltransferase